MKESAHTTVWTALAINILESNSRETYLSGFQAQLGHEDHLVTFFFLHIHHSKIIPLFFL
jgi:hypothetical protein